MECPVKEDLDKFRFYMVALLLNTDNNIENSLAPIEMMVAAISPDINLGDLAEHIVQKYNINTDLPVKKEDFQSLLDDYNRLMEERKLSYEEIIKHLKEKYIKQ